MHARHTMCLVRHIASIKSLGASLRYVTGSAELTVSDAGDCRACSARGAHIKAKGAKTQAFQWHSKCDGLGEFSNGMWSNTSRKLRSLKKRSSQSPVSI